MQLQYFGDKKIVFLQNRLFIITILDPPVHYSENKSTDDLGSLNNLVGHFGYNNNGPILDKCWIRAHKWYDKTNYFWNCDGHVSVVV